MQSSDRLHALDAARAIALIGGVVLHATLSFLPGMPAWSMVPADEPSRSVALAVLLFTIHVFRMAAFFVIAGFFARMLLQTKGPVGFARNRAMRIVVPLVAAWPLMMVLFSAIWIFAWSATHGGALPKPPSAPAGHKPLLPFPLTHLWFLYVLTLLYLVLVPIRCLIARLDRSGRIRAMVDEGLRTVVRFPLGVTALSLPVAVALYLAPDWQMWAGIPTPDQSLVPPPASAFVFALSFTVGWLLHRQPDLLQVIGRRWAFFLGFAVAMIGVCLMAAGAAPSLTPAHPEGFEKFAQAARYALALWMSVFALIALCVRFLSAPSKAMRFLADSSYWVYLVHLPLVFFLQFLASRVALPWEIKFPVIVLIAMALLLLSYRYLVRYSFIGAVLNGRRRRPDAKPKSAIPAVAQPV